MKFSIQLGMCVFYVVFLTVLQHFESFEFAVIIGLAICCANSGFAAFKNLK